MNFSGFKKLFFLVGLIFAFSFVFSKQVLADTCSDCLQGPSPESCFEYPNGSCVAVFPNCPTYNWASDNMSKCLASLGSPKETCVGASGGYAESCGKQLGPWGYCYASGCESKANIGVLGGCYYQYRYSYLDCGAVDTCIPSDGPYLRAGQCGWGVACDDTGCRYSGIYKTCCETSGPNVFTGKVSSSPCVNGCRNGYCPSGSAPVICGVSSCSGINATCTTAPCGQEACRAVAGGGAPTSPPGATSTPPPACESCNPSSENPWCAPNSAQCQAAGGRVISNPCPYCSAGTVLCCVPGSSNIKVNIKGVTHIAGDQVVVEVYQEPKNYSNNFCYYDGVDVKVNGPGLPQNLVVCIARGFSNPDASNKCTWGGTKGRCRTCVWDTCNIQNIPELTSDGKPNRERVADLGVMPFPEGYYVANVYYGGHSDENCSDGAASASDDTTLTDTSEDCVAFNPLEATCSPGKTEVPVDISSFNSSFNWNPISPWQKEFGALTPEARNSLYDCCVNNKEGWCVNIPSRDGTMFLNVQGPASGNCGFLGHEYAVSLKIPNLKKGGEYIVRAYGLGTKTKGGDGVVAESHPYMKLTSGTLTTGYFRLTDQIARKYSQDTKWGQGALKLVDIPEDYITVSLWSRNTSGLWYNFPSSFDEVTLSYCKPPEKRECEIIPSVPLKMAEGDKVSFNVRGNPKGEEKLSFWLVRQDRGEIPSSFTDYILKAQYNGFWYKLFECKNDGTGGCSPIGGTDFISRTEEIEGLPTGDYYVFCNVDGGTLGCGELCWGNPFCPYEGCSSNCITCDCPVSCSNEDHTSVTVTEPGPWFQTQEGSVVGESVVSIIPSSCGTSCSPACFRFLSLQGDGGTSGVVGVKNSAHDLALGAGDVSQEGWLAENPFPKGIERSTYDYISNRLAYENLFTERKDFDCDIDGCPLPTQTGVYQKESSGTPIYLKGGNITNGNKVVIFINGDAGVKLTGNITVDNQSFFALMVKGNLIIDSTVTQAQGIFFSDNYIILPTSGGTDSQFIGEGSFVGRNGILIERNLKGNNTCKPAALFKERPDFAINLPADFAYNRSVFQEVAP